MYISLPSSRRSHFPRCPKTMTRYKYINDLYRSYMCAHPHALCLGLGDGYQIPLWPNNADLSLYILDGSLTVYIRLDWICMKCQTWLFFLSFLSFYRCSMPKKTKKHCRIPCIAVWCIILVGAWQAMTYVAVASRGGQTIHSNLNVSVNRKDASFWRSNGIQPHERGGNVHKNIREEGKVGDWENKETRRFLPGIWWIVTFGERVNDVSIIENDPWKAMRSTFGLRGIARHSLSTTTDESRKGNEQNNQKQKNGKMEDVSNDGTSDDGRNNDRQVACFNYHQSLYLRSLYCTTTIVGCSHNAQHSQVWMPAMLLRLCINRRLRVEHSKS